MKEDEEQRSYLEKELDAGITYESDKTKFTFQRAKVKLSDELEIQLLKTINPELKKEFTLTEDKVIITYHPPASFSEFEEIHKKGNREKWQFAYNIIQLIRNHSFQRIKLIISPENILFDQGLVPHLLHYGVNESLPPYEEDDERLWLETKAIIAAVADNKHDFFTYLSHYKTKDLPEIPKSIMEAKSYDEIIEIIEVNIHKEDVYEQTVINIPEKKWKLRHYTIWILTILLVPTLIYGAYALFFKIPETNAYVDSNRYFLQDEYSSVVDTLSKYNHEKMPRIVQYELALSYIVNESLTEEQRKNIQNTITLQSDKNYYLYWIDIGRGDYQESIDRARLIEDRDLIIYGLLKLREEVKTDQDLSGEERKNELKEIQQEIDEYQQEMEEEQEEIQQEIQQEENDMKEEQEEVEKETEKETDKVKKDKSKEGKED